MLHGGFRVLTPADRKGYRYAAKTDSDKTNPAEQVTMCLKMYTGLGERRGRVCTVLDLKNVVIE